MNMKSISTKIIVSVLATLVLVLGLAMGWVSWSIWGSFHDQADAESEATVSHATSSAAAYLLTARESSEREFAFFKAQFERGLFRKGSPAPAFDDAPVDLSALQGRGDVEAPAERRSPEPAPSGPDQLLWNERPLSGDFSAVDAFTRQSGGSVATIFAREGDDYRRITTSLRKQDGERAFGTLLDRNHPAFALMGQGQKYVGPATLFGRDFMTVYEPIRRGDQTIGILFIGTEISSHVGRIFSGFQQLSLGETGHVYAVDLRPGAGQGRILGLSADGSVRVDLESPRGKAWFDQVAAVQGKGDFHTDWSPTAPGAPDAERIVTVERLDEMNWAIVSDVPFAEMMTGAIHVLTVLWLGVAAALVALVIVLNTTTARLLGRPITRLSDALGRFAQGDLVRSVKIDTGDEIGDLSRAMERFRESLKESLAQVKQSAVAVSTGSQEMASGNNDLSQRTETQASALEQTAASMEEMGSTVRHNADNAAAANQLATQASAVAEKGGLSVANVVASMKAINHSSQKIADIIGVIDSIAFQTNILALNAAVEAARAGEQGRGFAVVAGEVRTLAQRSAAAAKEIKDLIEQSVQQVRKGAAEVDETGTTMNEVVTSIRRVADMIAEIAAASREQSAGVSQVGEAVSQLDQTTQQNAALVEQMAAAASGLSQQAAQLVQAVSRFQLGGDELALASVVTTRRVRPPVSAPAPKPTRPEPLARPRPAVSAGALEAAAPPASPPSPKAQAINGPLALNDDWESF